MVLSTFDAFWVASLDKFSGGYSGDDQDVFRRAYRVLSTLFEDVFERPDRSQSPLDSRRDLFGMGVSVLMLLYNTTYLKRAK